MQIDILTLFPGAFDSFLSHSMMKRAAQKGVAQITAHNLRDYTHDRHKTCDDKPFGGGPGMLMKPEPIFEAVEALLGGAAPAAKPPRKTAKKGTRFLYMTPQGERFSQKKARELASAERLVILCGHYEGVDQRVMDALVTDEISIGDYVLTGGEVPAMVVVDAVVRLLKGTLGSEDSKTFESFSENLLEYPQYTRPSLYRGMAVPPVLLTGDHRKIELWRRKEALKRTRKRRPDLLKGSDKR